MTCRATECWWGYHEGVEQEPVKLDYATPVPPATPAKRDEGCLFPFGIVLFMFGAAALLAEHSWDLGARSKPPFYLASAIAFTAGTFFMVSVVRRHKRRRAEADKEDGTSR